MTNKPKKQAPSLTDLALQAAAHLEDRRESNYLQGLRIARALRQKVADLAEHQPLTTRKGA